MVKDGFAESIDYGIVGASGVSALCAVGGAIYAVPWSGCASRFGASKDYNVLWGVRVSMQLTAAFWLLSPVIQIHETWSPYVPILDGLGISASVLCRVYSAARLGWFEPFFLLTSLLTFRYSLRKHIGDGHTNVKKCNRQIIGLAVLSSTPLLVAHTLAAVATVLSGDDVDDDESVSGIFLSTHTTHDLKCDGSKKEDHEDGCTLCGFSLLSTFLSLLFILFYLWRMWDVTFAMAHITLNHSLEQRICVFRNTVTGLLLTGVLCRGLSVLSDPKDVAFELLRLGDFMSMVLVAAAASAMLVIRPVRDARMADKSVNAAALDTSEEFLGTSELLIS